MTEIQNIKNNIKGEIPKGEYVILHVTDIDNPKEILEVLKNSITTILENPHLEYRDEKWQDLLPAKLVRNVSQFDDTDYKNDDEVCSINIMVHTILNKNKKTWTWYSSKLGNRGFDVYLQGDSANRLGNFVRFQGVLATKIFVIKKGVSYPTKVRKDVISYKNFE